MLNKKNILFLIIFIISSPAFAFPEVQLLSVESTLIPGPSHHGFKLTTQGISDPNLSFYEIQYCEDNNQRLWSYYNAFIQPYDTKSLLLPYRNAFVGLRADRNYCLRLRPVYGNQFGQWVERCGLRLDPGPRQAGDSDEDGIDDYDEYLLGTDSNNPDSDSDGLLDHIEINREGTNPNVADSDRDNLLDGEEVLNWHTDPSNSDSDGDGLNDDREIHVHLTDPNNPDTDGDFLPDGLEVHVAHTDPSKEDTDGDGISDRDEFQAHNTDPLNDDTDDDGLTDQEELVRFGTDPFDPDTDDDGLSDEQEVLIYQTNPLVADSDDDGLSDFEEVENTLTDPLNPDTDADVLADGREVNEFASDPHNPNTDGDCFLDGQEVEQGSIPTIYERSQITLLEGDEIDYDLTNRRGKYKEVTILNQGDWKLELYALHKNNPAFTLSEYPQAPDFIPANSRASLGIYFNPSFNEVYQDTIQFETNDCLADLELSIHGQGQFSNLSVSPLLFDFGNLNVWHESARTLSISNESGEMPLHVSILSDNPAFYPIESQLEVAAGENADIDIIFKPYRYGRFNSSIIVKSYYSYNENYREIPTEGFGLGPAPVLSIDQDHLNFEMNYSEQVVELRNDGESRLYISKVELLDHNGVSLGEEGEEFTWLVKPEWTKLSLAPGESRDFGFTFQASESGDYEGLIRLIYNGEPGEAVQTIRYEGRIR